MRRVPFLAFTLCLGTLLVLSGGCDGGGTPVPPKTNGGNTTTPPPTPSNGTSTNGTPVEPNHTSQTPSEGTTTYVIDPDSTIMWNATVPIGTRVGGWTVFDGTIEMQDSNLETAKINVTVDMTSAYSDAQELTHKLQGEENFFNPVTYPTSTFKSTSVKKTANGYEVTGDFTIRGITKSFTFPADVELKDGELTAKARIDMNRQDFGITYQSTIGDYIIKDMCPLILDIIAKKKAM